MATMDREAEKRNNSETDLKTSKWKSDQGKATTKYVDKLDVYVFIYLYAHK